MPIRESAILKSLLAEDAFEPPVHKDERWQRYGLKAFGGVSPDNDLICDYLDAHPGEVPAWEARVLLYDTALERARAWKEESDDEKIKEG